MSISIAKVEAYFCENSGAWRDLAIEIEKEISRARDMDSIPVYLTKMRVKKPASAYLKMKRKSKSQLSDITDWIGVRVLCLFQQDLLTVHKYLINLFLSDRCRNFLPLNRQPVHIREVIVFNWDSAESPELIEKSLVDILRENPNVSFASEQTKTDGERRFIYAYNDQSHSVNYTLIYRTENRGSGYKSIHYSVAIAGVVVEFQLRTLLQDVWGELEHSLSYKKGKIHPHIKNSFQLLSRELLAKDILVSQLREVSDKERSFSLYARVKSGPSKWLSYDSTFVAKLPSNRKFRHFLRDYLGHFQLGPNDRHTWTSEWCDKLEIALLEGERLASDELSDTAKFFFDMERAFLCFCRGRINEAEEIYGRYANKHGFRNRWVVQYRLGEIHVVRGEIEDALVCFDRCEELLRRVNRQDRDPLGEFLAKQKLANVYWSLGEEYIDIAVEKIVEAEVLFGQLRSKKLVTLQQQASLLNNLCYYALERFIRYLPTADTDQKFRSVEKRFEAGNKLDARYVELRDFIAANPETANSNIYDTLAWCAFQRYKALTVNSAQSADPNTCQQWLKLAYSYLEKLEGKRNDAVSPLISVALQHDHLQEIMTAYDTEVRGTLFDKNGSGS